MSNTKKASKPQPQKLGSGKYAIFQTPEGDGVISYRPDGEEQDSHQVVPAKFWSMLMKILSGEMTSLNPMELMKMLMSKLWDALSLRSQAIPLDISVSTSCEVRLRGIYVKDAAVVAPWSGLPYMDLAGSIPRTMFLFATDVIRSTT